MSARYPSLPGLIGFLSSLAACLLASSAPAAESFEPWQPEGNWDQSTVPALVQSHDGYLWLATYHGLVRFDGARFTVFYRGNTPELQNGLITSLYETPDGTLWIGHETGHLTKFSSGRFCPVPIDRNWPGGSVEGITTDQAGDLWLLSSTAVLMRLRDGHRATVPGSPSPAQKVALARGADGKNWLVFGGKLATLEQGEVKPVEFSSADPGEYYERVWPSRDGGLWIVTNNRLGKWTPARRGSAGAAARTIQWFSPGAGFARPQGTITALLETRPGALLAGTLRDGLYLLAKDASPQSFDHSSGLSHNWVRCLRQDHEGNLWVGTGAGLDMLRARKIQTLAPPDAWKGCGVLSFAVEHNGAIWAGTEGAGLYRFERGLWIACNENCGLSNSFVWSVLPTRDDRVFVGTWGGGLFRRNGARFETPPELLPITSPVTSLYEGRHGEIWIGTTTGPYRYEAGKLVWSAGPGELKLPDVRAIIESADDTIWFGMSGGGIASLKDGAIRQYLQASGLGSDYVLCLLADADGALWIGTADNGITRLKNGKFNLIGPAQGLPTSVIYHLVDDQAGHLWIGSPAGILRVTKTDLNRCAEGLADSVPTLVYGRAEGLASRSCSGGFQPGACRTPDGRLWFPTPTGLAVLDPANVKTNTAPPPVVIEELLVDGLPVALPTPASGPAPPLRISPGARRFEFRYTALSFAVADKVRFRHRLEGIEPRWGHVSAARSVEYNLLSPGAYTFRVIACNNDGVWNPQGAALAFILAPFFWQTWWFQSAALAAGAGLVGAAVLAGTRRRVRRKLDQLEKQRSLERERARIARDIHDDLGASLTRISLLSQSIRGDLENPSETPSAPPAPALLPQVDQIYSTARELTRALDEIVWAVNPRHDTLDSLVTYLGRFTQQFLSAAQIRCRLDVPLQLPPWPLTAEIRHNVYLALKETLNNVVKHAAATEVRVSLELLPNGFCLLVVDNGQGFDLQSAEPPLLLPPGPSGAEQSLRISSGNGLANIRKRLEDIGGRCDWYTAPGEGTRVTISVPIPSIPRS
ncbi:MAG TPA: two-component regulator propeller domain-containing protein [Verrucomicrobiae bacterium]